MVVIDVHEKVAQNPDYTITMDDVKDWEAKHGPISEGAFVAIERFFKGNPAKYQTIIKYRIVEKE